MATKPAPSPPERPSAGATTARRHLPVWAVLLCVVLAFRAALLVQQAVVFASLRAAGCPEVSVTTGLSTTVTGFDGCDGAAAAIAAVIGVFGALLVAVPLLVWFRRLDARRDGVLLPFSTRQRAAGTLAYLLALAAVAESVAGSVVLTMLGRGEGAEAVSRGVPLLALVGAGLAVIALAYPTLRSTARLFVVDLVGHDPEHVGLMQKAVIVKLTLGVVVIAATRVVLG
ncbi:MAG: hypothetical protein HYX32_13210 [Actinobacteria bacterium]|nr:hypothetical protein [Actinomycetota bacterium]